LPRISLGILAGGRGLRLHGADKAFVRHEDKFLCERILDKLTFHFAGRFISAREPDDRYTAMNVIPVFDKRRAFSGPLAGIEALLDACKSEYLLSIPVDIKNVPIELIMQWIDNPVQPGIQLHDGNGPQPLFALWHVDSCLSAVSQALERHENAVHSVLSKLNFKFINRADIQIGNLNTPEDFNTL
ncbi:MAG: molybdenum cofactor guanylyltransferase, partial [Arenimonas sp.]